MDRDDRWSLIGPTTYDTSNNISTLETLIPHLSPLRDINANDTKIERELKDMINENSSGHPWTNVWKWCKNGVTNAISWLKGLPDLHEFDWLPFGYRMPVLRPA
jgi:hypothetical protein